MGLWKETNGGHLGVRKGGRERGSDDYILNKICIKISREKKTLYLCLRSGISAYQGRFEVLTHHPHLPFPQLFL